jgi:hypothetical protein
MLRPRAPRRSARHRDGAVRQKPSPFPKKRQHPANPQLIPLRSHVVGEAGRSLPRLLLTASSKKAIPNSDAAKREASIAAG